MPPKQTSLTKQLGWIIFSVPDIVWGLFLFSSRFLSNMCVLCLCSSQWCSALIQQLLISLTSKQSSNQNSSISWGGDWRMHVRKMSCNWWKKKKKKSSEEDILFIPISQPMCQEEASKQRWQWGAWLQPQRIYEHAAVWTCTLLGTLRSSCIAEIAKLKHHVWNWIELLYKWFPSVHTVN